MKHLPNGKYEASKLRFEMKLLAKLTKNKGSIIKSPLALQGEMSVALPIGKCDRQRGFCKL